MTKFLATYCHSKNYLYICGKFERAMNQTKPTYKQQGNVGLFDSDETMERLNKMGNPLAKLQEAVDFEMFRDTLEKGLYKEKFTKVGAKPYDYVLMFKQIKEGKGGELWQEDQQMAGDHQQEEL